MSALSRFAFVFLLLSLTSCAPGMSPLAPAGGGVYSPTDEKAGPGDGGGGDSGASQSQAADSGPRPKADTEHIHMNPIVSASQAENSAGGALFDTQARLVYRGLNPLPVPASGLLNLETLIEVSTSKDGLSNPIWKDDLEGLAARVTFTPAGAAETSATYCDFKLSNLQPDGTNAHLANLPVTAGTLSFFYPEVPPPAEMGSSVDCAQGFTAFPAGARDAFVSSLSTHAAGDIRLEVSTTQRAPALF